MVIDTEVRFGGTWRSLNNVEVRRSGSWRDCKTVEVKSGGVWRLVFENPIVTLSGESGIVSNDTTASPWTSTSGIRVNDDGTIDKGTNVDGGGVTWAQIDSATDWIDPNELASSDYEFRLEVTSLAPNTGSDSINTWIAMGSGSQSGSFLRWQRNKTSVGAENWSWTLRVRKNAGAEIDNGAYTGTNENGTL